MTKNKLSVGDVIPEFTLLDQNGTSTTISPNDVKKRIIYFYPKDDTKVCTEQACTFRDWQSDLNKRGFEVIGISSDKIEAHLKFAVNHNLNFMLLSDRKGRVRKLFGANSFLGLIPSRKTFVVNEHGRIEFIHDAFFEGEEHINAINKYLKVTYEKEQ